jgi:hypothetical protein
MNPIILPLTTDIVGSSLVIAGYLLELEEACSTPTTFFSAPTASAVVTIVLHHNQH